MLNVDVSALHCTAGHLLLLDDDCPLEEFLEAGRTAPAGAQALLHGGHQVLQVFGKVIVLIAKQVDLQSRLANCRSILFLRHPIPDPQHLNRDVVTRVHQCEEMLHKLLAQEDTKLPGESLIVPQNDIEDHEESVDGAGVLQVYLDIQWGTGYSLPSCPDGVDATPRKHWPPEGAVLFIVIIDGRPNLLKQRLRPEKMIVQGSQTIETCSKETDENTFQGGVVDRVCHSLDSLYLGHRASCKPNICRICNALYCYL